MTFNKDLKDFEISYIIELAWADDVSFDIIEKETGFSEKQVIKLMRSQLKRRSFEHWRKRVTGRPRKHNALYKKQTEMIMETELQDQGS